MTTVSTIREGEITALDTFTSLTGANGDSTNNAISVPPKVSSIRTIRVSTTSDSGGAAGCGSMNLKLTGDGLDVQQMFSVGGWSNVGTETSTSETSGVTEIACNIPVNQNGIISVFGGFSGSADAGTVSMSVELMFQ